ncbi:zinc ABC transporter substrate-binding protein [Paracoccaceae bacterium GXU_MW_L88]
MKFFACLAALSLAAPALAAPKVVTDIAPVHGLVSQVMEGVRTPELLLPPGTSPHGFALRPSQAAALQAADAVIWIGPNLSPWLDEAMESLNTDASIALADAPGTVHLPARHNAAFGGAHDHGHDHDDEVHDAHHGDDPHLWLDPENAMGWVDVIAAALAEADPENAEAYQANAAEAQADLRALSDQITADLTPLHGASFIVFHDAYQYFEQHFDMPALGAIAMSDGQRPSARQIASLRERVREAGAVCVFQEPQHNPGLVETVVEGTGAKIGTLDPIGADHEPGPEFYAALLTGLAKGFTDCLSAD